MALEIAVIGLGYVGLPLALHLAKNYKAVGFDINKKKIELLKKNVDVNNEGYEEELSKTKLKITSDVSDLRSCNLFIIGVPTPVDENNNPDFGPLNSACDIVGPVLKKGDIVVFESTVYPGVTEDICGPRLESHCGLKSGVDFKLSYSPERMNPGDLEHSLTHVVKVVSAQDKETLEIVSEVYSSVVEAGVHQAPNIKVAEAAKVIENTQRDLNIALMNELAIIFDLMGIRTKDVLDAAATKWNFVKFSPGLVGGHCIGVDPYYLTTKAEQLKYNPQVILAGRRINDGMGAYLGQKAVKLMINAGIQIKNSRVGILGVTFKENVTDVRNSRVPDIVIELRKFGIEPIVHDPNADKEAVHEEYALCLSDISEFKKLDALIYAVSHKEYQKFTRSDIAGMLSENSIILDVKSSLSTDCIPAGAVYWSL